MTHNAFNANHSNFSLFLDGHWNGRRRSESGTMGEERTLEADLDKPLQSVDKDSKLWRSAVEVLNPDVASIVGDRIPSWLSGAYLRVGPGKFDLGDDKSDVGDEGFSMNHWLDGYAIASKFVIDPDANTVSFQAKYLESQAYKGAMKHGRPILPEYGTKKYAADTGKGFFSSFISNLVPEMSDNPTTAYLNYDPTHSKLFVGGESCYFHEYDPETMTLGERLDSKELFGFQTCSMHPLVDPNDGVIYNVGTSLLTGVKYNVFKVGPLKATAKSDGISKDSFKKSFKIIATVNSRWTTGMSGIHSFGQTANHIVLVEQPFVGNVKRVLGSAVKGKSEPISASLEWYPESCNRFYVISKSTGEILNKHFEFLSDSSFFFIHIVNCYEEYCKNTKQTFVVVDISCFETPDSLSAQSLEQLRATEFGCNNCITEHSLQPWVQRFIIPLNLDGKKTPQNVDLLSMELDVAGRHECVTLPASNAPSSVDGSVATATRKGKTLIVMSAKAMVNRGLELPVINSHYSGKPYKYYYGSGLVTRADFRNSVAKVDLRTNEALMFRESLDYIFGEPIFVPRPASDCDDGGVDEDDGILLVPMTDVRKDMPDMLFFLNAKDMSELGRAVFKERVPPSIHGTFIPKSLK